jgi:hypothetical protein
MKKFCKATFLLTISIFLFNSCGQSQSRRDNKNKKETNNGEVALVNAIEKPSFDKLILFIENSASMYGYVNGATTFTDVVTGLAQDNKLVDNNTELSINLISGQGDRVRIYEKGGDPRNLTQILTINGLRAPTSTHSDLNEMFNIALDSVKANQVIMLVSDCIYDIGGNNDPLVELQTKGHALNNHFYRKLRDQNISTIVMKFSSHFRGAYYPACTPNGDIKQLDQERPFYVWIFGDSEIIEEVYSESRMSDLNGFKSYALFKKMNQHNFQYSGIGLNTVGYRINRHNKTNFEVYGNSHNANLDKFLTLAVDYSNLKGFGDYVFNKEHYVVSEGFAIDEIISINDINEFEWERWRKTIDFNATHLIRIKTPNPPPTAEINVALQLILPNWFEETTTNNDAKNTVDTNTTFGFTTLTNGITEAYKDASQNKIITEFNFTISK